MRRALLSGLAITALGLAAPGVALAHHGHHHHKSKSKAHHARVRFEHFGASSPMPGSDTTATAGTGTTPGATPPAPNSVSEDAGKIVSFTNEVLTISLNDGSTVSGKVTSRTEIQCIKATSASQPQSAGDESPGDDNGSGEDVSHEGDEQSSNDGQQEGVREDDGEDGVEVGAASEPPCDTSALKEGTLVREAELRVSSSGAEFESIVLVR